MDIQTIDPDDDDAIARTADQLGISVATLQQAVAAIGTDLDKVKAWLASRPSGGSGAR